MYYCSTVDCYYFMINTAVHTKCSSFSHEKFVRRNIVECRLSWTFNSVFQGAVVIDGMHCRLAIHVYINIDREYSLFYCRWIAGLLVWITIYAVLTSIGFCKFKERDWIFYQTFSCSVMLLCQRRCGVLKGKEWTLTGQSKRASSRLKQLATGQFSATFSCLTLLFILLFTRNSK